MFVRRLKRFNSTAVIRDLKDLIPRLEKEPVLDHNNVTLQTLMTANLHLGHSTSEWNPSMLPYLYGHRQGIHIINLEHTLACLRRASKVVNQIARDGGKVLFVGTKPSLHKLVVDTAIKNNAFYCIHWIGGLITNKNRVLRRTVGYDPDKVSQSLLPQSTRDELKKDGELEEAVEFLDSQPFVHEPDLLVLLDYPNTKWAVMEANKTEIPIVAICDSNCDADAIQYPIPANDDSLTGVELIARVLGKAAKDGYETFRIKENR